MNQIIKTKLEELILLSQAEGEKATEGMINIILASMYVQEERELFLHMCKYSEDAMKRIMQIQSDSKAVKN